MFIPDEAEIRDLHERLAPTREAFTLVYGHSVIVRAIAEQLLARLSRPGTTDGPGAGPGVSFDAELVRAGSLLHDIGVYRLYDRRGRLDRDGYIRHGVLGHELLAGLGLPESVCRFCSCHIGLGLSREDVLTQGLPLPPADYLPESAEEELVMYADKFHTKSSPPAFLTTQAYGRRARRHGERQVARFFELVDRFGEPDLATLAKTHGQPVR